MPPGGLPSGLLIGLPSLELRLQLRPERAVGPFFVPLPPIEEHPLPDLVAPPLTGGRQQVEEVPPQEGEPQGLMQGLLPFGGCSHGLRGSGSCAGGSVCGDGVLSESD